MPAALCHEPRRIVHLDADAFFASVEQAADPRLRGRPVAVGGERRGVIASASYEARRLGVRTAMPTAQARRICPGLIVVPGDFEKYERFSAFVFSFARDFTPAVEVCSIDEGYADVSGHRSKSAREIAEAIRREVRRVLRITLSEGVAANKLVAAVASKVRKPDALVEVPPGREREFLAPLPPAWLPGVGPKLAAELRRAGLRAIADVAATPPEQLELFAGAAAGEIWRMARGEDDRPVIPDPPSRQSLSEQETFPRDTADEHFLRAVLRRMADRLLARLRAEGRAARTVEVRIRTNDFEEARRAESFPEPTDLESDVYPALDRLLRKAWERRVTVRLVAVKFSQLYAGWRQEILDFRPRGAVPAAPGLVEAPRCARRALARAVDAVRAELGHEAILRGHDLFLRSLDASSACPLHSPPA